MCHWCQSHFIDLISKISMRSNCKFRGVLNQFVFFEWLKGSCYMVYKKGYKIRGQITGERIGWVIVYEGNKIRW